MADGREVDVRTLDVRSLQSLQQTFENDINNLTSNLQQLKEAHARYVDSAAAVNAIPPGSGRELMVPLTSSLYVPGTLEGADAEVLVDIGTGYYVGKPASEAAAILSRKAAMLKTNTEELQKAIAAKRDNLDVIVNSLAERAAAGRGGPAGGAGAP